MAIIDQQGATIGRSQMGPVAVAAAATATVAAGGQQQRQQKKIVGSVENGVLSCNFMLNVATNWLQQPTSPPPSLPSSARRVAALVGHYGECRLRCLLLTDSSADVLLPLCKGGRPRPLPLPLPLAASFAWLSLQRLNIYVLCT